MSDRERCVPELDDRTTRELLVGSYRLMYEVAAEVRVLAVVHGARDFTAWWQQRG